MSVQRIMKWGENKPVGLFQLALEMAMHVDKVVVLMELHRTGELHRVFGPISDIDGWTRMYRRHRAMDGLFSQIVADDERAAKSVGGRLHGTDGFFRRWKRMNEEERSACIREMGTEEELREQITEAGREAAKMLKHIEETLKEFAAGKEEESTANEEEYVMSLPFQFYFRVAIPCMMIYQKSPTEMMDEARHAKSGNYRPFERLLKVDKTAAFDKALRVKFMGAAAEKNGIHLADLVKALGATPKRRKKRAIKIMIAAALTKIAAGFKTPLCPEFSGVITAPEIKELFDAIASVKAKRQRIDADLPVTPGTLTRELHIMRAVWTMIPAPGRN